MKPSSPRFVLPSILLASFVCLVCSARGAVPDNVSVNARVFNGYTRTTLPDGKYKPETIVFAEGGCWNGGVLDKSPKGGLTFTKVARTIAGPLRNRGYISSFDSKNTDLLIMVFWGTTYGVENGEFDHGMESVVRSADAVRASDSFANGPRAGDSKGSSANDPSSLAEDLLTSALLMQGMENNARDERDIKNARVLGYTEAYIDARDRRDYFGLNFGNRSISEVEANRYFVVLKAYDYRYATREKKLKLLWEARYSLYERGQDFTEQLAGMTRVASQYFGSDTNGLVRGPVPEGKVEIGTPSVVPTSQSSAASDQK